MEEKTIKELLKESWIFYQRNGKIQSLKGLDYGEITLKFKEGRIYQVIKTETF